MISSFEFKGESLICSYDQKTAEIKDTCQLLRKNAIMRCNSRRESVDKSVSTDELFYEFPDSAYELLKQLLEMDCDKRVTAEDALKHPFFQPASPSRSFVESAPIQIDQGIQPMIAS